MAYELNGVLALADFDVRTPPGSFPGLFIPVPHPSPGNRVWITSTVCRIHILVCTVPGMYATTLFLVRASDFSLMGGCATDVLDSLRAGSQFRDMQRLADREFHWSPDGYRLDRNDSMFAVYRTFRDARTNGNLGYEFWAKLDVLYNWTDQDVTKKN